MKIYDLTKKWVEIKPEALSPVGRRVVAFIEKRFPTVQVVNALIIPEFKPEGLFNDSQLETVEFTFAGVNMFVEVVQIFEPQKPLFVSAEWGQQASYTERGSANGPLDALEDTIKSAYIAYVKVRATTTELLIKSVADYNAEV